MVCCEPRRLDRSFRSVATCERTTSRSATSFPMAWMRPGRHLQSERNSEMAEQVEAARLATVMILAARDKGSMTIGCVMSKDPW